jgi:hypothetical protein
MPRGTTDYQAAKDGVEVMDQLAELVDHATGISAADWAESRMNDMVKGISYRLSSDVDQQDQPATCRQHRRRRHHCGCS